MEILRVFIYFIASLHAARRAMAAAVSIFPPLTMHIPSPTTYKSYWGSLLSFSPYPPKRAARGKTEKNEKSKQNRLFGHPRPNSSEADSKPSSTTISSVSSTSRAIGVFSSRWASVPHSRCVHCDLPSRCFCYADPAWRDRPAGARPAGAHP